MAKTIIPELIKYYLKILNIPRAPKKWRKTLNIEGKKDHDIIVRHPQNGETILLQ